MTERASVRGLLAEVATLGEALGAAIERDDVVGAIAATMRMRAVRAELARGGVTQLQPAQLDDLEEVVEVTALALRVRAAELVLQQWLDRELPRVAELQTTPLGAAAIADVMLPSVWEVEGDLCVLVGPGLALVGAILRALGQRRIVVLRGDLVDGAIAVETEAELKAAVRTLGPCPPLRIAVRGPAEPAELATTAAREALSDLRIHRNTVHAFSQTWIDHGLANLPALARHPSVATLGDRLRGLPMVVVAPGPSLAKNAHLLRELEGRAVICAVGHALKPVIAAGVRPDLVLTVDPQDVRYHFAGCDLSRTTVVNAATVDPRLFELPAAGFVTLSANCSIDDWLFEGLGEDAAIPGGGSVATTAMGLALRLGCSPIIFVGLDLAFPGGQYYVATSHDGGARAVVDDHGGMVVQGWSADFRAMKASGGPAAPSERVIELPAWTLDGESTDATVPSSFMFGLFHRWFVERLASVTTRVINCTEGGAAIPGMEHRRLADVIATLPTGVDARAILDGVALDHRREQRIVDRFTAIARGLRRSRGLARRALASGNDEARLGRLERALARSLEPLGFASLLAQHEIERANGVAQHTGDASDYLAASRVLFQTIVGVVDRLEPAIRDALQTVGR
ncbi:MAG: DUF115 domain-containing protein [Proteobacteria bacterium]|nr:DUF115 domain-containing protein [Pseudomonadota bacterium]